MKKVLFVVIIAVSLLLPAGIQASGMQTGTELELAQSLSPDNLAVLSLEKLARRDKSDRVLGGAILLGSGAFVASMDDSENSASLAGGLLAGLGAITLVVKNPSEREYAEISTVEDPQKQEYMAYESLKYLANQGKQARITSGILDGALAFYYLSSKRDDTYYYYYEDQADDYFTYMALLCGGMSLYSFMVPSYAEQVYADVAKAKEADARLSLENYKGLMMVKLSYTF